MSRTVFYLRSRGYFEVLPRIRLTTAPSVGVGIGWLQAWFHIWLWRRTGGHGHMIELIPRIWFFRGRSGCYMHLHWLKFSWVKQLTQGKGANDATS